MIWRGRTGSAILIPKLARLLGEYPDIRVEIAIDYGLTDIIAQGFDAGDGQLVLNATTQIVDAALAGLGLAFVPEGLVQDQIAKGRLKRLLADWCPPYSGYHFWYPGRRQSSAAFALLVEALRYRP